MTICTNGLELNVENDHRKLSYVDRHLERLEAAILDF